MPKGPHYKTILSILHTVVPQILTKWKLYGWNTHTCMHTHRNMLGFRGPWIRLKAHVFSIEWIQFSSVTQFCPTLCDPMNRSTAGLPVHHKFPESTQTHVDSVGDAIQPSHPLSSPSPPTLDLSQHPGLFKWVSSSHQVAEVLEFQLQHQSFQWTSMTDLL